jgi:hypothetical protein
MLLEGRWQSLEAAGRILAEHWKTAGNVLETIKGKVV